jgi:hypothetical protein
MANGEHNFFQLARLFGVFLCSVTLVLYIRILFHQHKFLNENTLTHRLVVLNVRTALLVPAFSICYLISLEFTRAYLYMQLPQSIVQGYATFCFVALFVHYCGGPEQCLEIFRTSNAYFPSIFFKDTCLDINKYPRRFYNFVYFTQIQLLVVRPILIVAVIATADERMLLASNIISGVASCMVIIGLFGLIKLYHVLYAHAKGLNAKVKIIVIKGTLGLVLIEALVEQVLVAFSVIDDAGISIAVRFYCFGVLVELFVLSIVLERVFAHEIKTHKGANQAITPHIVINPDDDGVRLIPFSEFLSAVVYFRDLFAPLRFQQSNTISNPGTPALSRVPSLQSPLVFISENLKRGISSDPLNNSTHSSIDGGNGATKSNLRRINEQHRNNYDANLDDTVNSNGFDDSGNATYMAFTDANSSKDNSGNNRNSALFMHHIRGSAGIL